MTNTGQLERHSKVSAERRAALLRKWQQERSARRAFAIPQQAKEEPLPLSFAQERIWFLHQMLPESPGYNLPIAFRMVGDVNIPALEQSFTELMRRHAILRTTFPERNSKPVQVIAPASRHVLSVTDLRLFPEDEREEQLRLHAAEEYEQPFDPVKGPLFRTRLFQMADQEHLLLITMHHLITDGWSNGILIRELGELYAAFTVDQASPLPELSLQYADIANWERTRFQQGALEKDLAYWKNQLSGAPSVMQLPLDRPRPVIQTTSGAVYPFRAPEHILTNLQALCQREGVTSVMALLAAFKALLYRYTDQEDLVIGLPVFNRHHSETEGLIGLFVNTLVIRTSLADNPDFCTLLRRVRESILKAYEHQEYPFEKLVEALQPERDTSHTPLFQVMLSVGAGVDGHVAWPGLTLQPYDVERASANFDLTLEIMGYGDGLHFAFVYRTDLFDASTIERMTRHFCRLLEECVTQPDTRINVLPILSTDERQQILEHWNDTQVTYPRVHCLHQLFEEQAERTPEAIALVYEGKQLTYRQLNQQANQLAHFLIAQGVQPGVLVGITLERSLEMVVGLLGILKAGGAYVPLDPTYPRERLAYMLRDANVPVLLTQERLLVELPASDAAVVCLDRDWTMVACHSEETPTLERDPEHLAYVIYTSGSTGKPKGAMNTHQAICNRLLWMQEQYQLHDQDRVLQKTPFSFDVSVWEFFWPLITGARLVVARPEGHKDASYLVDVITREEISTIHFVPSMLQIFLEEPGVEACVSLQRVICSGEALSYDLQERFFERSCAALHNLYGPTEAAVDVTFWACERGSARRSVPIGHPVANTQIYILDQQLQPVPIGVAGELHIGGVQVGRGYLNRPELTAEKFIQEPFSQVPGACLYKTGDLARYLPDGTIEYLGRIDHQVKIRGLRIELGEIEAVLAEHPAVRDAVVVVKEIVPGDTRIFAYFTAYAGQTPDISEIRGFLGTRLPEYMVPASFVLLESMPLTPSGKIDRKQLPDPDVTSFHAQKAFVAPKNDIERVIAEIWQEVLHISQVGTQDNFFELGGHSLLVTQVRVKVRERLSFDLSIIDAFRFTTVQALAQHIGEGKIEPSSLQPIWQRAERQREAMKRMRIERR